MAGGIGSGGPPRELVDALKAQKVRAARLIEEKRQALVAQGQDPGSPLAPARFRSAINAWTRRFRNAVIMYHDGIGVAFALTGAHMSAYVSMTLNSILGHLVSDEGDADTSGGRKSLFAGGGIYSSSFSPALPVSGMIYAAYESMGESTIAGFPVSAQEAIPGGFQQRFVNGTIYYRSGAPWAHFVGAPHLAEYLRAGGPRTLGYPLTDSFTSQSVEFEGGSIHAHGGVTAVVAGALRRQYEVSGGPRGELGFPIANERDLPNHAGFGRYQRFEHGTLMLLGPAGPMFVVRPFRLFIGRINTKESDPWPGEGANDIYLRIRVHHNRREIYSARVPSSGHWSTGSNIVDTDFEIPVDIDPVPGDKVTLEITVFDSDTGRDDRLGTWTHVLTADDGWGLATNDGIFRSGSFDEINSITAAHRPVVDIASLSNEQVFWGAKNQGTPSVTWSQYAEAFWDVDNDRDWWDPTDWLDRTFYELVVQGIAEDGNCVGLSVESIYSRKGMSVFGQPLDRFKTWSTIRRDINVRHAYQVGTPTVYWFLGQFVTGNTHDPKDVFEKTERAFSNGDNPVLCLTKNYDFSGDPHCVVPVAWDRSSKPWRISISDPNDPQNPGTLTVNPDVNGFVYKGYSGGDWTGGRLHYIPFSTVSHRPRTPVWDAVVLLLSCICLFASDDVSTSSLTDDSGKDIDGLGARALADLQNGRQLDDYFVTVPSYDATSRAGRFLCRFTPLESQAISSGDSIVARRGSRFSAVRATGGSWRHGLTGVRKGEFRYAIKHGLSQFCLRSDTRSKELLEVKVDGLGMHRVGIGLDSNRDKAVELEFEHKLGVRGDRVAMRISNLAVTPAHGLHASVVAGFGGVEVIPGSPTTAKVSIEYTVAGQKRRRGMGLPIGRGVRIDLAGLLTQGKVAVSEIDRIGGPALGGTKLN